MNPAIKKLQSQATKTLLQLLDDMYGSCDDLFFDLASHAQSNIDQNLFFESMREIRIRTENSRKTYETALLSSFNSLCPTPASEKGKPDEPDELSIVDDDEVELNVAINTMTGRSIAIVKKSFHELHTRIESLYPGPVEQDENPLHPKALILCFVKSCEPMELDIKARIILLKQYERFVVQRLNEIYINANKLLESLGVKFIDERSYQNRGGSRSFGRHSAAAQSSDEGLLPDQASQYLYSHPALSELTRILGQFRGVGGYRNPSFVHAPLFNTPRAADALSSEALLDLLDDAYSPASTHTSNFDLREFLRSLVSSRSSSGETLSVKQVDEDIINLVAMFFDFVLDDHNIPDTLRALIARLQMPVLKIALRDKTFFTNTEHPCRHFINELSRIGIGVTSEDKGASEFIELVDSWVHRIQNESENTVDAFVAAHQELSNYAQKAERRSELVEKRTSESAHGEAKRELATTKAQQAIQEAMDGKVLAKPVASFIVQIWQQVLYRTYIQEGDEGNNWLSQLQCMHDLIWCAQPHEDAKSIARLQRIRPDMKEQLQNGLKQTTFNSAEINKLIEEVDRHIDMVSGSDAAASAPVDIQQFNAQNEEQLDKLKQQKSWKDMSAVERQRVQHEALTYEHLERADAIEVGTWLEFKVPASGTTLRCKLATKLPESDTYVFVNRLGFKTMERARKDFAFDLQRKRARILKTGPLFDRSLHKMVSSLKNAQ